MSADTPAADAPTAPRPFPAAALITAWALAVVSVAPALFGVLAVLHVLSGGLDAEYFGYAYDVDGNQTTTVNPDVSFWDRWSVTVYAVPLDRALLTTTCAVVALAGLHLASRGRWTVPLALRVVTALSAAFVTVASLADVGVLLTAAQLPEDEQVWFGSPSTFAAVATPVAQAVLCAVFAAAAAVVVLGPPAPEPPTGLGEQEEFRGAETHVDPAAEPPATHRPQEPAMDEAMDEATVAAEFPRLTEEDLACYRRPVA